MCIFHIGFLNMIRCLPLKTKKHFTQLFISLIFDSIFILNLTAKIVCILCNLSLGIPFTFLASVITSMLALILA